MINLCSVEPKIREELLYALNEVAVGEFLGNGSTRYVYEFYSDLTGRVIKFSNERGNTANVVENEIWEQFSETKEGKKWLAECYFITQDGKALVQERLDIITNLKDPRLPERIPRFLTDTKVQNWGIDSNGNVKCCDYGMSLLLQNNPWQLKKAEWWKL